MIYEKALRRELSYTTGGVFLVLITIMMTTLVIRILGYAATGSVSPKDVIILIMLAMIGYIAVILSVSIFIAIIFVLIRWHKDSEMVVWYASGLNLKMLYYPVLRFALPWLIVISAMSIFIWPWSNAKTTEISQKFKGRDEASMIVPGQFFESANSGRVFFVERINSISNEIQNVFVTDFRNQRLTVAMSESGYIENLPNGTKVVKIFNGRRYEGKPSEGDFKILEFKQYTVDIEKKAQSPIHLSSKESPTLELIENPSPIAKGELLWRIGLPLMALGLMLIAVPLAYVNPRRGNYIALLYAVFIYLIYSNLLNISQTLVSDAKESFTNLIWPLHVLAFLVAIVLVNHRLNPSIVWWKRQIPGGTKI
ncbi:LPS export ABC transporter permease LptF [Polynucleobacter kasalickyi]|uniref:Lipopolysaccharide export system permease protein LptF n=1 Tax=Polynucleobacter kasalickyi TaxID=1938817 RepID=A0A1W1ZNM2_9BURK|nr:LPS export ABC transporter permease LptF [Polynucleobacter kasalickyi]SMC50029.1 lipopolysaccharide export system permease protein [Polynucleobacter kasalickyi]